MTKDLDEVTVGDQLKSVEATIKFTVEAGLLLRSQFRRILDSEAHQRAPELEISYTESKGWLESSFFLTVDGPANDAITWSRGIRSFIDDYA